MDGEKSRSVAPVSPDGSNLSNQCCNDQRSISTSLKWFLLSNPPDVNLKLLSSLPRISDAGFGRNSPRASRSDFP